MHLNLSCPPSHLAIFPPRRSPQRQHLSSHPRHPRCSVLTPWAVPPSSTSKVSSEGWWEQGQGSCRWGPEAGEEGVGCQFSGHF